MRLIELLEHQDEEIIARLADEHLGSGERENKVEACINLEAVLRSPTHVRATLYNRRPPCFWILQKALDQGNGIEISGLKDIAVRETLRISEAVASGEAVGFKEEARLYRRVLLEAWRSDLELDVSEISLLGVLRHELGLRNVDHFLIEHHTEVHPFWNTDHAFLDVLNGLRSSGLVYIVEGRIVIPSDIATLIQQVLGLEAAGSSCQRLYDLLNGSVLVAALEAHRLKTSGSKAERINRLLVGFVQPGRVLDVMSLVELREFCATVALKTSGSRDALIDRVVHHFATNRDLSPDAPEDSPPADPEPRLLNDDAFVQLLTSLRAQDLSDILMSVGSSRTTGPKEHLTQLVVQTPLSESTLLRKLDLGQLESLLKRRDLKATGNKAEKISRLLDSYRGG